MRELIKKSKDILLICKTINKTNFNYHLIINNLILLNLKIEKILIDKKNKKGNPIKISEKYLEEFKKFLKSLKFLSKFDNFEKIIPNTKNYEETHKILFQKLWTNFNFNEYKKDRINRYLYRIKINNLEKLIKKKKIIDFGCGHGNFLISMVLAGADSGVGIDYGKDALVFAKKISRKIGIDKNLKFFNRSVYKTKIKNQSFDFAIQNGVFHHLSDENLAYKEVYRVLKPNAYFWVYTDGGGGIRDLIFDMSQKILNDIDKNYVVEKINQSGITTSKKYHLGDGLNAKYRHTTVNEIKKRLKKIGFKNFRQLNGGLSTDFDKPFYKDKYFKYKFGSGDIRLICQKKS